MKYLKLFIFSVLIFSCLLSFGQTKKKTEVKKIVVTDTIVKGFELLNKIPGLWRGPVVSATPAGNFPVWYVDFRPIGISQVSGISELDTITRNFMSFLVVDYNGKRVLAFRNGGGFKGANRIAYEILDSVYEDRFHSLYRFSDFKAGRKRVYTLMDFVGDSLIMQVFTNKYNTLEKPVRHMMWRAKLIDATTPKEAIRAFYYPQMLAMKDFTENFKPMPESVYFALSEDPYNEVAQPYLGKAMITISFARGYDSKPGNQLILLLTTKPLFDGIVYKKDNLKYSSRSCHITADYSNYTFTNLHPGSYYLYAFYDYNGNGIIDKGDYMNSNVNQVITVGEKQTIPASVIFNFELP